MAKPLNLPPSPSPPNIITSLCFRKVNYPMFQLCGWGSVGTTLAWRVKGCEFKHPNSFIHAEEVRTIHISQIILTNIETQI